MKSMLLLLGLMTVASVDAAQDPKSVFERACFMCHDGQMPPAPKRGDSSAWAQVIEDKGIATLVEHVTQGYNGMPPGGLCADCTAEDYQAVIEWMATPP